MADPDPRRVTAGLLLGGALYGALVAGVLGQDSGFDLRNYHWSNAWSLLHGRWGRDVAIGQLQSFFNPLIDLPYYAAVTTLGGAGTLVMGALHGLVIGLVGLLGRHLGLSRLAIGASLVAAAAGPVFLDGVGTSQGDLLVAAGVLGGLLLFLQGRDGPAAVLTGAIVGLKLTAAPFALALLVAALVHRRSWRPVLGGLAVGWAVTGAWWAVLLAIRTGNPVFPMANHLFQSPWADAQHYGEMGYFPSGLGWITLPLTLAVDGARSWSMEWRDARWLVLWGVGIGWAARRKGEAGVLLAWAATAWVVWEGLSSLIRYMAPIEALTGLLLAVALRDLVGRRSAAATAVIVALLVLWARPPNLSRVPLARDGLGVVVPPVDGPRPVVVTAGEAPLGYLAPSFPADARHLRISSSIVGPTEDTELNRRIRAALQDADPVVLVMDSEEDVTAHLVAYGLPAPGDCVPVRSHLDDTLVLCPLTQGVDR